MPSKSIVLVAGLAAAASAAIAVAQQNESSPAANQAQSTAASANGWVPPGTPGSEIDGTLFHAQVLMSAHGFSPGVIDGKKGESFRLALRSFQESRGLNVSGELDQATRRALLEANRPSTVMVALTADDVRGEYVLPFPSEPEAQAKLDFLGYRNMLEKVAERYHTTPATIVALNGPDKKIGLGQTLRLPNVVAQTGEYSSADDNGAHVMRVLNVDSDQPKGDYVVVDKSDGVLKVYAGDPQAKDGKLVAAFPVTMGSSQYPLPIGTWKATTYAFLPPFKYQPELLQGADKSKKDMMLPPGPNGPVGVAWLDLTKEHYGIHGTNEPQTIGRAESSGCIRMTNWDVLRLSQMMKPGFTAIFQA